MEKPLTYSKISIEKRKQLIEMVLDFKISIAKAARTLQIKNSTAKLIVKRYRQTGTFFQAKKKPNSGNPIQDDQLSSSLPPIENELALNQAITPSCPDQNLPIYYNDQIIQNNYYVWTVPWSSLITTPMGMLYGFT